MYVGVSQIRNPQSVFLEVLILHFIAASLGLIAGLIMWFTGSHWLASSILWAENRYPALVGSKRLRIYEVLICGVLVLGCFAFAAWITWLIV